MKKIFILGAGCWGSTLAKIYAEKNLDVTLWEPIKENYIYIKKYRHPKFFNFVKLPKNVYITTNINDLKQHKLIILVIPTIYVRNTLEKIKFSNLKNKIIISCTKGFEFPTLKSPTQLINEILGINYNNIFVFSGPSHAEEVASKKPTAITLAGKNKKLLKKLQKVLSTEFLRVYTNTDIKGVELSGAIKNIYAIAAGICDGLNLGNNAKAALLTRSIKEMIILANAIKANPKTIIGLSGIGDLLTTSYSKFSRNRNFGEYIASLRDIDKAKQKIHTSIEGLNMLKSVHFLAKKYGVDLPIAEEVYKIVYKNKCPMKSIKTLLSRSKKTEFHGYKL
ncbi:MAG: NAD(P)H-dependent glycerol-3-phosphate dehydrogenase [Endomicrobia bacterium]|nr:NAD(P)H-dependent glycerol-3-phosphate dehydrogenase [Endomicrobiia bacterium]